jgi:hypothetical protein
MVGKIDLEGNRSGGEGNAITKKCFKTKSAVEYSLPTSFFFLFVPVLLVSGIFLLSFEVEI